MNEEEPNRDLISKPSANSLISNTATVFIRNNTSPSPSICVTKTNEDEEEAIQQQQQSLFKSLLRPTSIEISNSSKDFSIRQTKVQFSCDDPDFDSESDGETPQLSPKNTKNSMNILPEKKKVKKMGVPKWLWKLFFKALFIFVLLIPGLVDRFILVQRPALFEFTIFFWSIFVSMLVFSFFTFRYFVDGVFAALGRLFRNMDDTKVKEIIERAACLRDEIALALFSYSMIIFWVVHLQNECSRLIQKCSSGNSNCNVPSVCTNQATVPPSPVVLMQKFLGGIAITCTFYLAERTVFQIISVNFHTTAYKDRIEHSEFAAWALDKLNSARKTAKKVTSKTKRAFRGSDSGASVLSPMTPLMTSPPDSRLLWKEYDEFQNTIRDDSVSVVASGPTSENLKRAISLKNSEGKPIFTSSRNMTLKRQQTEVEQQNSIFFSSSGRARIIAEKLYYFLVSPGESNVTLDDIRSFFDDEKTAMKAFEVFDKDGNGIISLDEVISTVVNIYKERRRLIVSLVDVENALQRLHYILLLFTSFVLLFIWLALFEVNITVIVTTMASALVAIAFVIGSSAKNAFESIVFLFVMHPYDVGDRVFIKLDSPEHENLIVHSMNLLTTVFRRWDGTEIYIPNHIISTKQILNMRRSADQWDPLKIELDFYTPKEVIQDFKALLSNWLKNPQGGSKDFHPNFQWFVLSVSKGCQLTIQVSVQHRKNWQDMSLRWARREKFVNFVQENLRTLDIRYAVPVQPVSFWNAPPNFAGENLETR